MKETKKCSKCGEVKSFSEFNKQTGRKFNLRSNCKSCMKSYRISNKEKEKERHRLYYEENKEKIQEYNDKRKGVKKEYNKKYNEENKERISKQNKVYSEKNKEKLSKQKKEYYIENKERISKQKKVYRNENPEKIKEKSRLYYMGNKEKISDYKKTYSEKNKEKLSKQRKEYYIENKETIRSYQRDRERKKVKEDALFKLKKNIRSLIRNSINNKGFKKTSKTANILGCSFKEFEKHLNNNSYGFIYGDSNLDLDHIIPLATATTEEEVLNLNYYTNFQLLPREYNRYVKKDNPWDQAHFKKWMKTQLKK